MAIHAEPAISTVRNVSPFRTDYTTWKLLAWTGPVFLFAVFVLWGIVARNMPPFPPARRRTRSRRTSTICGSL